MCVLCLVCTVHTLMHTRVCVCTHAYTHLAKQLREGKVKRLAQTNKLSILKMGLQFRKHICTYVHRKRLRVISSLQFTTCYNMSLQYAHVFIYVLHNGWYVHVFIHTYAQYMLQPGWGHRMGLASQLHSMLALLLLWGGDGSRTQQSCTVWWQSLNIWAQQAKAHHYTEIPIHPPWALSLKNTRPGTLHHPAISKHTSLS